ncbi:MAG: hypothetical protein ACI8S3_002112, partial [Alphaproteobacteria bacterium]
SFGWVNIGETHMEAVESTPTGAARLTKLLRDHLHALSERDHLSATVETPPDEASLDELVAMCLSIHKPIG